MHVSTELGKLGYNTGATKGLHNSDSNKEIVKFDWNINDNHKLAVIYNFLDASKDKPAHPTAIFVEVQMLLHYNSQIQDTKLTIK
jgi:hypothetical protein